MQQRQLGCRGKNREGITLLGASIRVRVRVRVTRSMKVNVGKHRKAEQAKEADMLEPKGTRPGWDFLTRAHGDEVPPVYVTDLRHSSIVKGRNVVSPYIRLWAQAGETVRRTEGYAGKRSWRKRMPVCNGSDTGCDITRPKREQTSGRCLIARESGEPLSGESK